MTGWRALRRRIITPNVSATDLSVRGFHIKDDTTREILETVGASFLAGFGHAVEARVPAEADRALALIPPRYRGFAYEGAAMGLAILDALPLGGGRLRAYFDGRGDQHVYMGYVGVGWAMARLPKMLWSRLYLPDPLLRWLAVDGYGFHQAYFKTDAYVRGQFREPLGWPREGPAWYVGRVLDQGIGRATWFVCGADPARVVATFDQFDEERRADLYSGAGLAATYAGGADEDELREFWDAADPYQPHVAQGAAFAAGARVRAGLVMPHNELATQVFCGLTAELAAKVTDDTLPADVAPVDGVPAYEIWRLATADELDPRRR